MNLYRAMYRRPDGKLRPMTYAAHDEADAERTAKQWACGDLLLSITLDRHLQPQLVLA